MFKRHRYFLTSIKDKVQHTEGFRVYWVKRIKVFSVYEPWTLRWLILGWVVMILSFLAGTKIAASGGAMVGASVIAQAISSRANWRYKANYPGLTYRHIATTWKGYIVKSRGGAVCFEGDILEPLLALEAPYSTKEGECWEADRLAQQVDLVILIAITATAFLGTIIWAYGPTM